MDVPVEALEAATEAALLALTQPWERDRARSDMRLNVGVALTAALPHIEAAIRQHIANEIEKLAPYNCELRYDGREDQQTAAWVQGVSDAAELVRGRG